MAVRIKINAAGLNEALSQQGVRDELRRIVDEVATKARGTAPVVSGAYRDGIHSDVVDGWVRPRGKVYADAAHSTSVEAATGNLARSLSGQGGLVKYTSKSGRTSYITQAQYANYTRNRG